MLRPLAATLLAAGLVASCPAPTAADGPESRAVRALSKGETLLRSGDARAAVPALESALAAPDAATRSRARAALLDAYESAARQADALGRAREAEGYRENLDILRGSARPSSPSPAPTPDSPPRPPEASNSPAESASPPESRPPTPLPRPEAGRSDPENSPSELPPLQAPAIVPRPQENPGPAKAPDDPFDFSEPDPAETKPGVRAAAEPPPPTDAAPPLNEAANAPSRVQLERAAAAFKAHRYPEAKILFDKLAQEGRLPDTWRESWAYCRWHAVVTRINARPQSPAEWAALRDEVEAIGRLMPNHWFDQYLKDYIADRAGPIRRTAAPGDRVVVRGASPEERRPAPTPSSRTPTPATPSPGAAPGTISTPAPATPRPPAQSQPRNLDLPAADSRPLSVPGPADSAPPLAGPDLGNWRMLATTNFRIYHADPELARRIAEAAEAAREAGFRRWSSDVPGSAWTPSCEIYLYPNARVFSERTGQPEDSPGFSTSGSMAGRVTARRINLRADYDAVVEAVVPHEVSHIVLADLFPDMQIPRWADEGMAVLAEPEAEQHRRASDLAAPLRGGRIFAVEQLIAMDYPEGEYWPLYYAQSISLTRFLVELGTPARFVQFLRDGLRDGTEVALKTHYQIDDLETLQERWIAHARAAADNPEVADHQASQAEDATLASQR